MLNNLIKQNNAMNELYKIKSDCYNGRVLMMDFIKSKTIITLKKGNLNYCNYRKIVLSHASKILINVVNNRNKSLVDQTLIKINLILRKGKKQDGLF